MLDSLLLSLTILPLRSGTPSIPRVTSSMRWGGAKKHGPPAEIPQEQAHSRDSEHGGRTMLGTVERKHEIDCGDAG